ncbi:mitochondrial 54S ribosomal protein YmL44 [Scheffersomyces xylosifermentans]|uniref:mitochondrial 54S ribosomal protein YmL44 n=1 Tax=Scheffersomyces xylosifermentans TaxID=1304137 RepID=UPI00315C4F11
MITKYFANVAVKFDPFTTGGRAARLFLARVPSSAKIEYKVLPKNSTIKPEIQVTFKDKFVMKADPSEMNINDLRDYFNTHSRKLAIKDAISE